MTRAGRERPGAILEGDPVVPTYAELLDRSDAPPGSSWGLFGAGNQLGTMNFLTPQRTARAAKLVRTGRTYNLDYPVNGFSPSPVASRGEAVHHIFGTNPNHRDDWLDNFYLQSTSQIDSLRHIRHPRFGFYGGVPDDRVDVGSPDLGIQLLAERGIAGRGVLLDVARVREAEGRPMPPDETCRLTPEDLDAVAVAHGVALEPGDIVLVRTGWSAWYLGLDPSRRRVPAGSPGLDQSVAVLEWLWDHRIAMVASDNVGVEAKPITPESAFYDAEEPPPERGTNHNGMAHRPLIALLGIWLGELWALDELADACAEDGRYEFFLVAKPLNVLGGVGSPPNAIALK